MEKKFLIYACIGCILFLTILLLLIAFHSKNYKYDLDHKPSESLFSKKRDVGKSGLFGMDYNNNDSEDLNNLEIQIIDSNNISEFEEMERYSDIENDPDKVFMANLCEKMEYDLKEKIKQGHCICFKVPLRTKVIRDHAPSTDNSDELNLNTNDVVLLTKIFDDGWAFGSRAKGRFREGAFPICCLENRYELFKLLPKRENYDANLFNIDRYSSIRLCKNSLYQYYYHPVINAMKYFNNSKNKKMTILDVAQLEKENDISNCEVNEYEILNETYNNKGINDKNLNTTNSENTIKIPDLPKRPRPLSYEEKVLSLRRSLERRQRQRNMKDSNQTIVESDINFDDDNYNNNNNKSPSIKNYI